MNMDDVLTFPGTEVSVDEMEVGEQTDKRRRARPSQRFRSSLDCRLSLTTVFFFSLLKVDFKGDSPSSTKSADNLFSQYTEIMRTN